MARKLALATLIAFTPGGCAQLAGISQDYYEQSDSSISGSGGTAGLDGGPSSIAVLGEPCSTVGELACAGHAQKLVLICDPKSHTWTGLQSCSGKQLCDSSPGTNQGSCQDPVPVCIGQKPGARVCDANRQVECGPDLLTATTTDCPNVCEDGMCTGACKPQAVRCDGNVPQTCSAAGAWQDGPPCPYVCAQGECTGVCAPDAKQCNGNVPQSCSDTGQWDDSAPCPRVCSRGVCADSCSSGETQCSGSKVISCDGAGQWQPGAACPYVCKEGTCTGECGPGTGRCTGLVPQTCDAQGSWQSGTACEYVCTAGACTGACKPGGKDCQGLTPRSCDPSGQWQSGAPCAYVCSAGACTGVCTPQSKQCSGNTPQSCDASGEWQNSTACQYVCTAGTCAGSCAQGAKQCNGLVPQTCNASGQWDGASACPYVCSSGSCTGVCTPATKQCSGQVPQSCDANGQWQSAAACQNQACASGVCQGVCTPGAKQCNGNNVQTCQSSGQWDAGTACSGAAPNCSGGNCIALQPSCSGLAASCGPGGNADCCASGVVPGGSFNRIDSGSYPATVSAFRLDTYEVTVGRFRKFVAGYPGNKPATGSGKNPNNALDPGWDSAWTSLLPLDQSALKAAIKCASSTQTWTDSPSTKENRPINCVTWYQAYAFCIWDGGRLPTEAEWYYAAAGGNEQRHYPWSNPWDSTTIDDTYAVYCGGSCDVRDVGIKSPKGDGKWGHADLAGNVWEFVLDWYRSPYLAGACANCANLTPGSMRVVRGGGAENGDMYLGAACRGTHEPEVPSDGAGLRCVRTP
jgi:formylglycine-generating enzyme required for sulfatase activity